MSSFQAGDSTRVIGGPSAMCMLQAHFHDSSWAIDELEELRFTTSTSNGHPLPDYQRDYEVKLAVHYTGSLRIWGEPDYTYLILGKARCVRWPEGGPSFKNFGTLGKGWVTIQYDPHERKGIIWFLPENPFRHPVLRAMCDGRLDALSAVK